MSEVTPRSRPAISYRYQMHDIGVFTEIYLPKKIAYQGILYETLKRGFDFEAVKRRLMRFAKDIREFLENYTWLGDYIQLNENSLQALKERFKKVNQLYWGYSMYEVDGVFF